MAVSVARIGELAGVGRATAYRVLTEHPGVSAAVRSKVMRAVRELGYPNLRRRGGRRRRLDYVLWSPLEEDVGPDAFLQEVFAALERTLAGRRKRVRKISYPLEEDPDDLPVDLLLEDPRGIFTTAFYSTKHLTALARRWPVACLLSTREIPGAVSIAPDYAQAARLGTELLLSLGHRRIGLVTGRPELRNFSMLFTEGYSGALATSGLPVDPSLISAERGNLGRVKPDKRLPLGREGAAKLLGRRDRPTAVLARLDSVEGVLAAAGELGLDVPRDLSVFGFGTPKMSGRHAPVITSACFFPQELVDRGMELIGSAPEAGARALLRVQVLPGASVASPAKEGDGR